MHHSFLADPHRAGPLAWHENAVGHRHIRRGVSVEDELRRHRPAGHSREPRARPRDRNSVNASVTVAEIVVPDRAAVLRTRAARDAGSLTVNTTLVSGTGRRSVDTARST